MAAPIAVIGVTEKGVTSLELTVEGRGGHASTPARNGPTARLARAILRLERAPFPASTPAPTVELLRRMAPHASLALRPLLANAARLGPVLTRALIAAGPESAAMTRTTVAVTTLSGSPGPQRHRQHREGRRQHPDHGRRHRGRGRRARAPGDRATSGSGSTWSRPTRPARSRRTTTPRSACSRRRSREVFPDAVPSPYVMMAATDSRHFTRICERVYRYTPFRMTKAQRESIHSYDEHLGVDDFVTGIDWYQRLIERIPS